MYFNLFKFVGITSFRFDRSCGKAPGAYTNVTTFEKWILYRIKMSTTSSTEPIIDDQPWSEYLNCLVQKSLKEIEQS